MSLREDEEFEIDKECDEDYMPPFEDNDAEKCL